MSKTADRHRKLFFDASWLFGGNTVASIFAAIEPIVLARMLGVNDYGLFALIIAYIGFLNKFFDFRVWETAVKYIGTYWQIGDREKTGSMIKLSYIIDISSGILAFAIAALTAKIANDYFIRSPEGYILIWIYSFSLLIDTANSTSDAILRVFDRFKKIAFISSLETFSRVTLVCIVLFLGIGIKGVLFCYIGASFLGFSIRFWTVSSTLNDLRLGGWWKARLSLIMDQWRGIAWFLGNTSLSGTLRMGNDNYIGVLALGYFAGKDAAAYYKIARSVIKLMTRFSDPLHQAMYPELVRIKSLQALQDFTNIIKFASRTLIKFTLPLALLVLIFSDQFINLFFGKQYLPASNTLRILTAAVIISQLTFWINSALLAMGKVGLRTFLDIISTTAYILLLLLLVPGYSYVGAALAYLGQSALKSFLSLVSIRGSIRSEEKRLANTEVPIR